jgi:hypothetical protein
MSARRLRTQIRDLRESLTAASDATASDLNRLKHATDEMLMFATGIAEVAREYAEDFRQAAYGNVRVACQWCDGEFYAHRTEPGPHTCHLCRRCDGY